MSLSRLLAVASADLRVEAPAAGDPRLPRPAPRGGLDDVPRPSSGKGILSIGGRRVVYTSAALAVATAGLLPFLLGLFGFYAVSNAIALDRRSGVGPLLGATPVTNGEYLLGKLLGNLSLLSVVTLAFSVVVMAVQVVHGEAPLEPLVFLAHLLVVALPALLAVASFALLFECVPFLSGRFGDVAFFFVWVVTLSMPVFLGDPDKGRYPAYAAAFDWNGLGFLITEIQRVTGSGSMTIGWGAGTPQEGAAVVFPGFGFSPGMLGRRALAFLPPLALLPVALLAFDRFDPARRLASASTKASLLSRLSALLRPASARLLEVVVPAERAATKPGLLSAALTDLLVTLRLRPLLVVGVPSAALVALLVPPADGGLAPLRRVRPPGSPPRRRRDPRGADGSRASLRRDAGRGRAPHRREAPERGGHGAPPPRPVRREGLGGSRARPAGRGGRGALRGGPGRRARAGDRLPEALRRPPPRPLVRRHERQGEDGGPRPGGLQRGGHGGVDRRLAGRWRCSSRPERFSWNGSGSREREAPVGRRHLPCVDA